MQSVNSKLKVAVPSVSTVTKPKNTIRDKVKSNQKIISKPFATFPNTA